MVENTFYGNNNLIHFFALARYCLDSSLQFLVGFPSSNLVGWGKNNFGGLLVQN